MAFALGPKALAAGYRLAAYESIGSTSTRSAGPGDAWRSGQALGRRQGADRRAMAAAAAPGRRRRQSRRQPADRPTGPGPEFRDAWLRRRAGARKRDPRDVRHRSASSSGSTPLGECDRLALKWPNDVLVRRRQSCRHPARGGHGCGGPEQRRHRHRRQRAACAGGDSLSGDVACRARHAT